MRRPLLALLAVVMLFSALLAGSASALTPNASSCRSAAGITSGSTPTTTQLFKYDECRFDKLDAAVTDLGTSSPAPSPTPSPTMSPSPTATPSASQSLTPTPTASPTSPAFPGASSTGVPAGTTLTASGALVITTSGTVVDGKSITGGVIVRASNVTIRNSRIKGDGGAYCVQTQSGGTVTLEDVEIVGGCENGIGFDGWTAKRTEITGTYGDGVKLGSNVLLQDSWIHDLAPANGAHADGGQVQGGVTNTTVRHNTLDLGSTPDANAALFIAPDQGPTSAGPLVIDGNRLNGGNYVVYCVDGNNGAYFIRSITWTGNRFGASFTYGRSNVNVPITQSGNVIDATGAPYTL